MKKLLLTLVLAFVTFFSYSQYVIGALDGSDSAYKIYLINVPNKIIMKFKDTSYVRLATASLRLDSLNARHNTTPGGTAAIPYLDDSGYVYRVPISALPVTVPAPTFTFATRPINGTTFTISTSKNARVYYTISISCTATIGSTSAGDVLLEYSTNGGSTWNAIGETKNSNTVALAIILQSVTTQITEISADIPANALCRLTTTSSGTTTVSYVRGQEVLY